MATSTEYGNLVNYLCMPTENDHYGSGYGGTGAGRIPQELTFLPLLKGVGSCVGFVESGFVVPATGGEVASKIVGTVSAGAAVINGCRIVGTSTITVSMKPSATNYLFLKLELDGTSKIYRPVIHIDDAAYTIPTNAIPLGAVVCGASSVTSTLDFRYQNRHTFGYIDNHAATPEYGHAGSGDWSYAVDGSNFVVTFKTAFFRAPMALVFARPDTGGSLTTPDVTITSSTLTWAKGADNYHFFMAIG